MGKVSKRLNIIVTDPAMLEWSEIKKLQEQGHCIYTSTTVVAASLVFYLGPTAWRMNDKLKRYLPMAIKAMRAFAYPKEVDDGKNDTPSPDPTDAPDETDGAQASSQERA